MNTLYLSHRKKVSLGMMASIILMQSTQVRADWREDIQAAGIIGGAVAGVYLAAQGISYLFSPSNNELIHRSHLALSRSESNYGMTLVYVQGVYGSRIPSSYNLSDEPVLYRLAVEHVTTSISSYISQLRESIRDIQNAKDAMIDRMRSMERSDERYSGDYRIMASEVEKSIILLSKLQPLEQFVSANTSYVALYQKEAMMMNRFAEFLSIIERYQYDRITMNAVLRDAAVSFGMRDSNRYPLLMSHNHLVEAIESLGRSLQRCAYNYPNRIQAARAFMDTLSVIDQAIITSERYVYEQQAYEHARREEERLRLEQERVAIEREKAVAERRKARAQEEQNAELRRQNRNLEEQNRLERLRQQHQHCYQGHCSLHCMRECPVQVEVNIYR